MKSPLQIREKVQAVKAIPDQIRWTLALTMTALLIAMIALSMTIVGGRRAN